MGHSFIHRGSAKTVDDCYKARPKPGLSPSLAADFVWHLQCGTTARGGRSREARTGVLLPTHSAERPAWVGHPVHIRTGN